MKICMSVGHGKIVRGASGSPRPPYLDEVDEACRVVERVARYWNDAGVGVETFFDTTSTSQNQNLNTIVAWHNARSRDRDVSCHFNAYQTTSKPMGHETLYVTQQSLATEIAAGVARAGGFINRGAKKRTDLYFLNNTAKPAVLLEVCFVDSSADADLYRRNFEAICKAIAETIAQITIGEPPPTEPPLEPQTPLIKPNHQNIITSVFGGTDDPNSSAYSPYDTITDTELSCALPWKFAEPRPMVRVFNADNELSVLCAIRDVGPWLTDDSAYVLGNERPLAEPAGTIIPRGPNKGEASNGAGLDLSPGAAVAIELYGMGTCHWMFEEEGALVV